MKKVIIFIVMVGAMSLVHMHAQTSIYETTAVQYLQDHRAKFGVSSMAQLKLYDVRKGNAGETLRFNQEMDGVTIFQADVTVHFNKAGVVTYVAETPSTRNLRKISAVPALSEQAAMAAAKVASAPEGEIMHEEVKLFVLNNDESGTILVYRVLLESFGKPGSWEVMVDAQNGEIISIKDIAQYCHHPHHQKSEKPVTGAKAALKATGTAYVYNPDPLSVAQATYGGNYVDNNDATNASLDAARTLVTLDDVEFDGGLYKLKSQYVEIAEIQAPATGLFTQTTPDFLFNRNDQGFEAVNVFWHFHQSMKYINETLGIACLPTLNNGRVRFDPHGQNGNDNSAFYPGGQYLTFGEGGVDDGEDAHVILHELGHGVHYWITGNSSSSAQGLGEGSGDYWAMSYTRSLNLWPSTAPQYHWVFPWDGHNPFWNGRVTNYSATYPTPNINNGGAIHANGQIWATTLMRIYDIIGKEKTDRAFLEGLALTNSTANQQTAAVAVRQAALNMVGTHGFICADVQIISQEMTATGYNMPAYSCTDLGVADVKKDLYSIYPNPVSDVLNVRMTDKEHQKGRILNMEGRLIREVFLQQGMNRIHVAELEKGNYILQIGQDTAHKFIKK
ncbi:T9SS type A sorting domain-containing protein [Chryseobacterium sp. MFBS3-17]|uniref:T9SS type A sorting domain-containing protein n=1 Tax=Chryseobacterium sp. MFBS3-17 TaxID=2886689 RepID=UPI001D0ED0CC|nr:T9SS type A sorting domain-containing protein [Chryseobacterium sp. MFBS3-17]MCC2591641.1 T9SS type A sorting domain-containing protein [Chryseobacterium sp. MFBS3-17]